MHFSAGVRKGSALVPCPKSWPFLFKICWTSIMHLSGWCHSMKSLFIDVYKQKSIFLYKLSNCISQKLKHLQSINSGVNEWVWVSRKSTFCSERLVYFNLAADMGCLQFLPEKKKKKILLLKCFFKKKKVTALWYLVCLHYFIFLVKEILYSWGNIW